jgi:hypothetical protein
MIKKITKTETGRLRGIIQWFIVMMMISLSGYSQNVAINTTLSPANASAGLDIDFANKGFLITRVALTGTNNAAPLTEKIGGMLVYNTSAVADVMPGIYYNDGTRWVSGLPQGSARGDMQYWNGTRWTIISGGIAGQYLKVGVDGTPVWSGSITGFPTLSTDMATAITTTTATSGGNITNNGGTAVTARGVCWGTSPNPTVALSTKTTDGSGNGTFTSGITGLVAGTLYYVRAYATNSLGTEYGNQVTFTTN